MSDAISRLNPLHRGGRVLERYESVLIFSKDTQLGWYMVTAGVKSPGSPYPFIDYTIRIDPLSGTLEISDPKGVVGMDSPPVPPLRLRPDDRARGSEYRKWVRILKEMAGRKDLHEHDKFPGSRKLQEQAIQFINNFTPRE